MLQYIPQIHYCFLLTSIYNSSQLNKLPERKRYFTLFLLTIKFDVNQIQGQSPRTFVKIAFWDLFTCLLVPNIPNMEHITR